MYGLQSVLDMRHGTLENDIGCVVEKPVLVHAAEMMYGRSVKPVDRLVVGVFLSGVLTIHFTVFNIVYFVAHEVNAVFLRRKSNKKKRILQILCYFLLFFAQHTLPLHPKFRNYTYYYGTRRRF